MSELPGSDRERDAKLAGLYRAAPQDEPPLALDDAIRAAARRAVASKPRSAGAPFSRSWRVPLSIAAVLVLSVSLVTLMREQMPAITQPTGVESAVPQSAAERQRAESPLTEPGQTFAPAKTLERGYQAPSGLGLKPSSSSSAEGIRRDGGSVASVTQLRNERAADRMEAGTPSNLSSFPRQTSPDAFPRAAAVDRDKGSAAPARKEEMRRDIAAADPQRPLAAAGAPAEAKAEAVPAPQASVAASPGKPAVSPPSPLAMEKRAPQTLGIIQSYAGQPPDKWLELIEDLRKQGRLDEARASLADFRKRYPDYQLPAALKEWVRP